MRLNFWQILGVLLVVAAIAIIIYQRTRPDTPTTAPQTVPPPVTAEP